MRHRVIYLTIALLALVTGRAETQRHLMGMRGVQLTAEMADGFYSPENRADAGYAFSLAVFTYAKGGHKWVYGGEVMRRNHPYRNTGIPVVQYTGEAGYYRNFFSCPGKVVLLNIGLSGLMGFESVNGGKRLLDDGAGLKRHGSFIYGGAVTLEAEVCLTDRLSLGLRLRERVLWGGAAGHFHTQYGILLNYIF